jgi:hypothetical protein
LPLQRRLSNERTACAPVQVGPHNARTALRLVFPLGSSIG